VEKILENLWVLAIAIGSWMVTRLTSKIDKLESSKAEQSAVADQQKEIKCLDKRVDEIDHATQLRLVPRDEYKFAWSEIRQLQPLHRSTFHLTCPLLSFFLVDANCFNRVLFTPKLFA